MTVTETPIDDIDIIFISYDEPMKDRYWQRLIEQTPFAKRVDGVTGFDAAHKEAARIAETDRFITVDGDTTVNDDFFDMVLRYDEDDYGGHVFSWAGTNDVNGLVYGNGSLKCWPREKTLTMETHEVANEDRAQIEFCWSIPYLSMKDSYSMTHPAPTPYHAFRAGIREGVKMTLDQGKRVDNPKILFQTLWEGNIHKLLGWTSLGADHQNGLWAMYGARMGVDLINKGEFEFEKVADYEWFPGFWDEVKSQHHIHNPAGTQLCELTGFEWDPIMLADQIDQLGQSIKDDTGKYIPRFTTEQSRFYKEMSMFKERETARVLFSQ